MKKTYLITTGALAALSLALIQPQTASAQVAVSQTTSATGTTTQTTTSAGTLTSFDPAASTIMISASEGVDPVSYSYTKQTTVVDSTGATVAVDTIKPGIPTHVEYLPGDVKTIQRIVVEQPVAATTTTTTTAAPAVVVPAPVVTEKQTTTTTTEEVH